MEQFSPRLHLRCCYCVLLRYICTAPPPASCPLLVFASRPFVSKATRNQPPSHQKVADDPPAQAARNTAQALFRSLLMALDPVQQRVCCGRLMSQGRTHGTTILLAMAFLATLHASSSPVPQTARLSQHRARRRQQRQGLRAIKRSRCTVRCAQPAGISCCPRLGGQREATIKTRLVKILSQRWVAVATHLTLQSLRPGRRFFSLLVAAARHFPGVVPSTRHLVPRIVRGS